MNDFFVFIRNERMMTLFVRVLFFIIYYLISTVVLFECVIMMVIFWYSCECE